MPPEFFFWIRLTLTQARSWISANKLFAGMIAASILAVLSVLIDLDGRPSQRLGKEQMAQARIQDQQREAERRQRAKLDRDELIRICDAKARCYKYSSARQECAVAGSYEKCMEIRLATDYGLAIYQCTPAGELAFTPKVTPGWLDCQISRAVDKLN